MAKTERLDLYKVPSDPAEQETTNFNTETMLNENWNKIDKKVALVNEDGKVVNKDGTLAGGVEDLQSDLMYQIPNIVGTQIRINKLSNTNRLFFKLETDLTGDVTISTDGGTTEKPLVDVDENQITQLEKGFVEVVADANFFILRNRGISGADKQALIDIVNEAEANESDLKTLFVNAVNDVDTDGGIDLPSNATWADILAVVPSIKTGKRLKVGTQRLSLDRMMFTQRSNDAQINSRYLHVTGLDFSPQIVIVFRTDGTSASYINRSCFALSFPTEGIPPYQTDTLRMFKYIPPFEFFEDGFIYPIDETYNEEYTWIAIE